MDDYSEKMQRCNEYIEALEEERRKIQVFQRELPLCLELVTQAIEASRQQLSGGVGTIEYFHGPQSDCSEQTSSEGPVLEEFMPIKRSSSSIDEGDDEPQEPKPKTNKEKNNEKSTAKKSDWLRSVQLWNPNPDPPTKEEPHKKELEVMKSNGGAFKPFNKEKLGGVGISPPTQKEKSPSTAPTAAASSTTGTGSGGVSGGSKNKEDKEGQSSQRKQRRCWSPELHRRFLRALQELGGAHVATPKQIREHMKVDGLTNDEVKSHLQKYRLHTRRPNPTIHNNGDQQAPQFVLVGGLWVPPPDYATMAAAAVAAAASNDGTGLTTANGIYAPVAAPPPLAFPQASASVTQREEQNKSDHSHSDGRGSCRSKGRARCDSPATSSSTRTTTASPVF